MKINGIKREKQLPNKDAQEIPLYQQWADRCQNNTTILNFNFI